MSNSTGTNSTLHIAEAMSFLRDDLLGPLERQRIIAARFKLAGKAQISSKQWEIFAALLLGRNGSSVPGGTDLDGVEVKSAVDGSSFEYQYHRRVGKTKLVGDAHAAHLFISYVKGYREIEIRILRSGQVHDIILGWEPRRVAAYAATVTHERCRVTLPYALVHEAGETIMSIRDGAVVSNSPQTVNELLGSPSCASSCHAA
jgi:hypothetical protein